MMEMKLLFYIMESTVDSYEEEKNTINKTACDKSPDEEKKATE